MNLMFLSSNSTAYYVLPILGHFTFVQRGIIPTPHIHPVYHLMFIFKGSGILENESGKNQLNQGDIVVINPNQKHIYSSDNIDGLYYFTLNFYLIPYKNYKELTNDCCLSDLNSDTIEAYAETSSFQSIFEVDSDGIYIRYNKSKWSLIVSLIENFNKEFKSDIAYLINVDDKNKAINDLIYNTRFTRILFDLYMIIYKSKYLSIYDSDNKNELFSQIIEYLQSRVHDKYSLSDMADALRYNHVYICSFFKQKTGVTIGHYFNKLKILKACEYLRTTDKTISDIAALLNYSSSNHFSQSFKKEKSISPKDYRKQPDLY